MRNTEKIPKIVKEPYPHVVVKNFLDEQTLDLVTYALAGLEYDFDESNLYPDFNVGIVYYFDGNKTKSYSQQIR